MKKIVKTLEAAGLHKLWLTAHEVFFVFEDLRTFWFPRL